MGIFHKMSLLEKKSPSSTITILIICLMACLFLIIPLNIVESGFLPVDDALRHAARVISGKDWHEILLMRPDIKMDSHPGWHTILSLVQKSSGCNQNGLVVFSVVLLFFTFCMAPLFFLKYPESWLISLLVFVMANSISIRRLFYGRPYIISMACAMIICFVWPKFEKKKIPYAVFLGITLLIAVSTWIHPSWYLYALPVACFFLARRLRTGLRMAAAVALGIILGACLSGQPYLFLTQSIKQLALTLLNTPPRALVNELQPFNGDIMVVLFVGIMLIWRRLRGKKVIEIINNPVFLLAFLSWLLGFFYRRFWLEWGLAALCVWATQEFQAILGNDWSKFILRRIIVVSVLSIAVFSSFTNDTTFRWTDSLNVEYLEEGNPLQKEFLPEAGGIIYSDRMSIFYQTFFKNPKAPWRYVLGFEAGWMTPEDLSIWRKIQLGFKKDYLFEPWVEKMQPQDRLILRRALNEPPQIKGLVWRYVVEDAWIGKLPAPKKTLP